MLKNPAGYLFTCLILTVIVCLMPAGYISVCGQDQTELELQIQNLDEQIDFMVRFINRALQESPQEAVAAQDALKELVAQREELENELKGISSDGKPGTVPPQAMVKTAEFGQIKKTYDSAGELAGLADRTKFETKTRELTASLENSLAGLENKAVTGRWVRQFFVSEFQSVFRRAALDKGFEPKKTAADEEIIGEFYKEIDFIHEGFVTLRRGGEYHPWLRELLKNRLSRSFGNTKKISFQKRLKVLKITGEQYRDKLNQLMQNYYDYSRSAKPARVDLLGNLKEVHPHRMIREPADLFSEPVLIGILKTGSETVLIRRDGMGWKSSAQMTGEKLYEEDLFDAQSPEETKLILIDRRYIKIEGGAILTGWELESVVSETLEKEIAGLIKQLGDDDWQTRETATQSLMEIGIPARSALEESLNSPDPEVQMRAKAILKNLKTGPDDSPK